MQFISTKVVIDILTGEVERREGFWYEGELDKVCGASGTQTNLSNQETSIANQQANAYQQLTQQAQQIFGSSSQIFNDLTSAFQPILAAGPNQQGYNAAEMANLNSQAITQTGQAYRNAAQAAGERTAASGGGGAVLPSGAALGQQAQIASAGAGQTASELANIRGQSAQLGRQNWLSAASVLSGAPNVFSPATSAAGAATSAGNAAMSGTQQAFQTAGQIAQLNNWWQPVLGGVLGGAASMIPGVGPIIGPAISGALGGSTGGAGGGITSSLGQFNGGSSSSGAPDFSGFTYAGPNG